MSTGKIIWLSIISFIGLLALVFMLNVYGLASFAFFAPKQAKVERHVFENTPSYVQGKIQDLSNYKLQIDTSKDLSNKAAIKATIRSQFANFNISDCPDELKLFLQDIRGY